MSDLTVTNTLTAGTPENVGDVQENFTDVVTWANGNIDSDNFTATTNQTLGLSETGTSRRGKSIIATEQTTTSTTYTTLTTPDRVQNIVLPTDGLLCVAFQGMWKESVVSTARAAIFVGATQLKIANDRTNAVPIVQEAALGVANQYKALSTTASGLNGAAGDATGYTGDVTTGQVVGVAINASSSTVASGPCYIHAAAGTYTVSVQFKVSSGTFTAKERKLWVWTQGFG